MMINTIANHLRQQNNEPLTLGMLKAELAEFTKIKKPTRLHKTHIEGLKRLIEIKEKQN
jgi:hypothetical protein